MGYSNALVEALKKKIQEDHLINQLHVFLCRKDGVVLYTHKRSTFPGETQSVGALASSAWQAAEAMGNFVAEQDSDDFFRLSFDTSDKGLYILPLKRENETFFIGAFFRDVQNPAQMKNRLRNLVRNLRLEKLEREKKSDEKYLFQNITDDEIDKMFSFVEE